MKEKKNREQTLELAREWDLQIVARQMCGMARLATFDVPDLCRRLDELEETDAGKLRLAVEAAIVAMDEARNTDAYAILRAAVEARGE